MDTFKAFRISETDGKSAGRLVEASLDELTPGDVVIKTAYSSVNYKDVSLAGTGTGRILELALSVDRRDRCLTESVRAVTNRTADARCSTSDR